MSEAAGERPAVPSTRVYWALRVAETVILVVILIGIGLFAYSLVDIVRIESAPGATNVAGAPREIPPTAYPGFALFFGGMIALQVVRVFLHRYRRDDGTARGDARGQAAAATAEALDAVADDVATAPERSDAPPLYSDDKPALSPADDPGKV